MLSFLDIPASGVSLFKFFPQTVCIFDRVHLFTNPPCLRACMAPPPASWRGGFFYIACPHTLGRMCLFVAWYGVCLVPDAIFLWSSQTPDPPYPCFPCIGFFRFLDFVVHGLNLYSLFAQLAVNPFYLVCVASIQTLCETFALLLVFLKVIFYRAVFAHFLVWSVGRPPVPGGACFFKARFRFVSSLCAWPARQGVYLSA